MPTPFVKLAELCEKLEKITERIPKIKMLVSFILALDKEEIAPAVRMIIGKIFPDWSNETLDISWGTIIKVIKEITRSTKQDVLEAFNITGDPGEMAKILVEKKGTVKQLTLLSTMIEQITILQLFEYLQKISKIKGEGSRAKKEAILRALLSNLSPIEVKYVVKIILGEMRHGVNEGLMEEALAKIAKVPVELIERAHMMLGDIGELAVISVIEGATGLKKIKMRLFHPIKPMLASQVESVIEALKEHGGRTAFEFKLDGARVQIHKDGDRVRIYSRRLTDVTESLPDIVEIIKREIRANQVIIEGEVIAIGDNDKPLPFQYLMKRFRRVREIEKTIKDIPVKLYLFDCLFLDGELLIDLRYDKRWEKLEKIHGNIPLVPRIITDNANEAQEFFKKARDEGHEGLMAKKLDSEYTPGKRGKKWLKIKEVLDTLDLVIVAADWGYGRRKDWLSDYYLAARDPSKNELLIVGKTFKGLTDEEFREITKRLLELKIGERGRTVFVKPEIVVEVAFDEIQRSPKYRSGYALRFARIVKIRYDKKPEEADTIIKVKELFSKQFEKKAKLHRKN